MSSELNRLNLIDRTAATIVAGLVNLLKVYLQFEFTTKENRNVPIAQKYIIDNYKFNHLYLHFSMRDFAPFSKEKHNPLLVHNQSNLSVVAPCTIGYCEKNNVYLLVDYGWLSMYLNNSKTYKPINMLLNTFAHEMMHCYQYNTYGSEAMHERLEEFEKEAKEFGSAVSKFFEKPMSNKHISADDIIRMLQFINVLMQYGTIHAARVACVPCVHWNCDGWRMCEFREQMDTLVCDSSK